MVIKKNIRIKQNMTFPLLVAASFSLSTISDNLIIGRDNVISINGDIVADVSDGLSSPPSYGTSPPPSPLPSPSPLLSPSPSPVITAFDVCGIRGQATYNAPGQWPPSGHSEAYYQGYGGLSNASWPHKDGEPPYYAMCTNAQHVFGVVSGTMSPSGADLKQTMDKLKNGDASPFSSATSTSLHGLLGMLSDVMSLSYALGVRSDVNASETYVASMSAIWNNNYETLYKPALLDAFNETGNAEFKSLAYTLSSTFQGHIQASASNAIASEDSSNFEMVSIGNSYYPANFQFCLASQINWDYGVSNPKTVHNLADDRMYRCTQGGLRMNQIQSQILHWEMVSMYCPTKDEIYRLSEEYAKIFRMNSDFVMGTSTLIACTRPNCSMTSPGAAISEPRNSQSHHINGMDYAFFMNLYVKFLDVHVRAGLQRCDTEYVVIDPTGFTSHNFTLSGSEFAAIVNAWDESYPMADPGLAGSAFVSPFPGTVSTTSSQEIVTPPGPTNEYGYYTHIFPCTSSPRSGCNNRRIQPVETAHTMSVFNNTWRRSHIASLFPPIVTEVPYMFEEDDACVFDPISRMKFSKFGFDINASATLDPPYSPHLHQIMTFAVLLGSVNSTDNIQALCDLTMAEAGWLDGDIAHMVPPWGMETLKMDRIFGPLCDRCKVEIGSGN